MRRRLYIEGHLKSLELEYKIIDAVDYQEFAPGDFAQLISSEAITVNPFLTKGVLACALSHAKVYALIAASNDKAALLIEDDTVLAPNIKELLDSIELEIKNDEIICLSYYTHISHDSIRLSLQNPRKITGNSTLFYPTNIDAQTKNI